MARVTMVERKIRELERAGWTAHPSKRFLVSPGGEGQISLFDIAMDPDHYHERIVPRVPKKGG